MSVELTLGGGEEAVERLYLKTERILTSLTDTMNELMLQLQSDIVSEKLHGQVLHQRTGKLAGSIRAIPTVQEGETLVGAVEGGGGVAWYGRIHEYGMDPYDYEVTRHIKMHYGELEFKKLIHSSGFPERSFMRSSLSEFQSTIVEAMQVSLDAAVAA